jgi:shikimate 5-dehydrogenase
LWALNQAGAKAKVFARNAAKARGLGERFGAAWVDLKDARFGDYDVVVNATPLGTAGNFVDQTPASVQQLRGARLAYDLVYNPTETRFLREAREAGCKTLGGLAMLAAQAAEQLKLWTGAPPTPGVMEAAAERGLGGT